MKLAKEDKVKLALLVRERKDRLQGASNITKKKVWDEIFNQLIYQEVPVTNVDQLKTSVWDNIKRTARAKRASVSVDKLSQLDRIVLDIIEPRTANKTEPSVIKQADTNEPDILSSSMSDKDKEVAEEYSESRIVLDIIEPRIAIKTEPAVLEQADPNEPYIMSSSMSDIDQEVEEESSGPKPYFLSMQHRTQLALLMRNNKDVLQGPGASSVTKARKWDEICRTLASQGAKIRSQHHLRYTVWDYMKRKSKLKALSGSKQELTYVDQLVLDFIGSSTVVNKERKHSIMNEQAMDSGIELSDSPKEDMSMPFVCTKCCKSFKTKNYLTRHDQLQHEDHDEETFANASDDFSDSLDNNVSDIEGGDSKSIFDLCKELERRLSKYPLMAKAREKAMSLSKLVTSLENETSILTGSDHYKDLDKCSSVTDSLIEENACSLEKLAENEAISDNLTFSSLNCDIINTERAMTDCPDTVPSDAELNIKKEAESTLLEEPRQTEAMLTNETNVPEKTMCKKELNPQQSEPKEKKPTRSKTTSKSVQAEKSLLEARLSRSFLRLAEIIDSSLPLEIQTSKQASAKETAVTPVKSKPGEDVKNKPDLAHIPHKKSFGRLFCLSGRCKIKGISFAGPKSLEDHFKRLHLAQEVPQKSRKMQLKTDQEIKTPHLARKYQPLKVVKKSFICEVCGESAQDRKLLIKHIQTHKESQVTCTQCELKFPTKYHHESHVKRQHTLLLKCNVCEKTFGSKKPFEMHMMIHNGVRPYVCETCGNSYITKGARKTHNLIVHLKTFVERPRKFACQHCEKRCVSQSVLTTHTISVHMNARNYKCVTCNLKYKTSSQLKAHERKHKPTPEPCKQCSLVFNCKANLRKHMSRKKLSCPSYEPYKKSKK